MIKIEIKNRFTGKILFEYQNDNATLRMAVLEAIKNKADLSSADLRYANLRSADLRYANLRSADLRYANLSSADLSYADLRYANLSYANLSSADLRSADLRSANLSSADLSSANLRYANLSSADLRSANLSSADLSYADLRFAKGSDYAIAVTRICPDGDIVGWKKCANGVIVKLLIPKDAKRNNAFGRKCRAEFADVIEIIGAKTAVSSHDSKFLYEAGKRVSPTEPFNEDFTDECSAGIHFFITRIEAENYS